MTIPTTVARFLLVFCVLALVLPTSTAWAQAETADDVASKDSIRVIPRPDQQRVDILVGDEELFTSYIFPEKYEVLKKPVLYPINTALGTDVTRAFPLQARAGERTDHPHQIGLWFNYGDVNGYDFWNNSNATPEERRGEMGHIVHRAIRSTESGENRGVLVVTAEWRNPEGEPLLEETTRFVFRSDPPTVRSIDRITTLTALDEAVRFTDNKEGMLGLRVRRELEMPVEEPLALTDARGEPMDDPVMDNEGVSGHYYSSEGVEGYPDVWGTRAAWMALEGEIKRKPVTVAILDHPDNPGYPTYWHARNYGLLSANPLGQKVFSEGQHVLNFALEPGESATFRYRVLLLSEDSAGDTIRSYYERWANAAP